MRDNRTAAEISADNDKRIRQALADARKGAKDLKDRNDMNAAVTQRGIELGLNPRETARIRDQFRAEFDRRRR